MTDDHDGNNPQDESTSENEGAVRGEERPDNEYYNFLNLPRNASDEEINAAYKKLSRLYHPDKHLDPDNKKKAEHLFAKLKLAHEGKTN